MKKTLFLITATIILLPQVASAAWWNPLSWFERENVPAIQTEVEVQENQSITATEDTSIEMEPAVKERVVEKTITVDNPELQRQINGLLQENADLKVKVSSLTSSLNMCRATSVNKTETSTSGYSDFNFSYVSTTNKITFPFSTSRDIVIKKAVFHIRETDPGDTRKIGSVQRLELVKSTGASPIYYNLENNGSTFTFLGTGIPLKGKESLVVNVAIANPNGKETETFFMVPDFSQWEVWDNTTDKPVRIE